MAERNRRSNVAMIDLIDKACTFLREKLFEVLSFGPIPRHIAFILDGNRRYAKKWGLKPGEGHRVGYMVLLTILKYCYEMGVECVSLYTFSIDNFRREPDEIQLMMDLFLEKTKDLLGNIGLVNRLGVRVRFIGRLELLDEPVRLAAEEAMRATGGNTGITVNVCIAYTSTDEVARAVQCSYEERSLQAGGHDDGGSPVLHPGDLDRNMDFAGCADPDILIRTSGETRLSNFLLWQTAYTVMYAPCCLWPEMTLWHLVWAVLQYQKAKGSLEKKKKKLRAN